MRVDIGNNIIYESNFNDVTLSKASEAFTPIKLISGRGQLVEASLKFDSEKINVQMIVDGQNVIDIDIKKLKSFYGNDSDDMSTVPSINYSHQTKVLMIKFQLPIQYSQSIEFLARTNDGNKRKKLKGFIVIVNEEVSS